MLTFEDVKQCPEINTLLLWANGMLETLGYTEHGLRHTGYVSATTAEILRTLGHPERVVELGAIAGWVHDVGNGINRKNHGLNGAVVLFPVLKDMGFPIEEICEITSAVGNHEEQTGHPVTPIAAALILADKSDAHRTRVRRGDRFNPNDIHDRVNYAIRSNSLRVDEENRIVRYRVRMDATSSVMEFLQIYMSRMEMSEKAAKVLGCTYQLSINGMRINSFSPEALKE
ncbi:MAG: HD domain-containing protein [Clostridia bacterium]|nr:HD domain-containing protein [Clostridia bacterium]